MPLERRVDGLALRPEGAGIAGVDDVVAGDDCAAVGVGRQQAVSPREHGGIGRGVVLEANDDEIKTAGAEQLVMIVVVRAIVPAVVAASREARAAEVLVVERRGTVGVADRRLVVIADAHTKRDAVHELRGGRILERLHRTVGIDPLDRVATVVAILDAVAQLDDSDDIARDPVGDNPTRLRIEHRRRAAIQARGVVLRVGQADQREVGARAPARRRDGRP